MNYHNLNSFLFVRIIVLVLFVGGVINVLTLDARAQRENNQEQGKIVKLAYSHKPIIKISQLKINDKSLNFAENFEAEADWLKNLSFNLENQSGKKIILLQVNLNFPETRATGNMMSYTIRYGRFPEMENQDKSPPLLLNPDESIEVLINKEYERLAKFINSRTPIEFMRTIELEIGFVIFDDKTAWNAGSFSRQDPNNPRRYVPIESEQ